MWGNPGLKEVYFSLAYLASEGGDEAAFNEKCNGVCPGVVLVKIRKGGAFGGFTFGNWEHLARDMNINRPNLCSASRDSIVFVFDVGERVVYVGNFGSAFEVDFFQIFDHINPRNCI